MTRITKKNAVTFLAEVFTMPGAGGQLIDERLFETERAAQAWADRTLAAHITDNLGPYSLAGI